MRRPSRATIVTVLLVGTLLVFHEPFRHAARTLFRLPLTVLTACTSVLLTLPRVPALARENAELRTALMQRQLDTVQLREALRHVEHADALLEASPSRRGIVAVVIGRSTIPTQQTVLLNKGARDGLVLESVIMDVSGVLGRVTELESTTALVTLLTDVESRVAGIVERSRETGLVVGRGRGRCEFIYLSADVDLQDGDRIVTAGLGGPFPKGVLLGTVTAIARDEVTGSAWASVELAAHLGRLEEVLVLPPSK